ncbi:putative ubiquitin-conjugating enzyme E2 [Tieghemostelium lacteum]|uniref:Putative ubiquitin-conjugating enzyme E2 n=1 Tax=Tieghemostelium lacteum TaxID=361077 RepID=A0A151ZAR9_TIELA|nr:putative ubiquitin-conjugating enzyme E2 [Tieghemostelium lacteum]|eukprot:KYQ91026.1 putative ubiquitin-conjugating enzyme E2 [Tieghemostelium lacteum]
MSTSADIVHPPTKECIQRLKREFLEISKNPVDNILVTPHPSDILSWYYVILGPENTPYEGGIYFGQLIFKYNYPLSPPSILMNTPNGRFECDRRLCLSISDYHPESWLPSWSVSSILIGLLSFMVDNETTVGSINTTNDEKRLLASKSADFNKKNSTFCSLFPYLIID